MKQKAFFLPFLLGYGIISSLHSFSQEKNRVLDSGNMRPGEEVEYCGTHKKLQESLKDPEFAKQYQKEQAAFESLMLQKSAQVDHTKNTVYTIPVVFHVLHNGGAENISRAQIIRAVEILNRDYAMLNADTAFIQPAFQSLKSKADIRFVLATKTPTGECFSGITRTLSSYTNLGDEGYDQVNAIVNGNDVYNGQWPGNKYLNIFVCKDIGGAAGYTTYPSSWSANNMTNGIWVLQNYVGDIGTSSINNSRTLTHEVGHWLNLAHLWGSTNNPGVSCGSDNVNDTPECIGSSACVFGNSCNGDNAYWGFDQVDNIENYMEYSYCSKMFTIGQVDRMRTAIVQMNTGRGNVISASNLADVGAHVPLTLCQAKFTANRTVICQNETVQFSDESFNASTGWNWTFQGGTPASSSSQNPLIVYETPGVYPVKLEVTDGSSSLVEEINGFITVLPNSSSLPFYENFEGLSNLSHPNWFVENPTGPAWSLFTNAGSSGSKSASIQNFSSSSGGKDYLYSKSFDLSEVTQTTGLTLTFKAAFRRRLATNNDLLQVETTSNCGNTWELRRTLTSFTLSGGNLYASNWVPAPADWITFHVTNIPSSSWTADFRFRMSFTNGGGNNIYVDDINLYAGPPSNQPVLSLNEHTGLSAISLYPNPANDELQIAFQSYGGDPVAFSIHDVTGKLIQKQMIYPNDGQNVVILDVQELSKGTYFLEANGINSLKFIKD